MMLDAAAFAQISLTALACTAVVSLAAFLLVRRGVGLAARLAVLVTAAIVSIVCSALAVAREMYLSHHDVVVLGWVFGVSACLSLAGTLVAAGAGRRSLSRLGESARRLGDGVVVPAQAVGWRELDELSAELAASSARLAESRAEVERLDASRRQLVAWVSHDLRTPLAGIRALAEALEEGTTSTPTDYVRRIRTQVDSVSRMVDGLFALSQIHSGTLQLHKEPIVLLDLVSDAVTDMAPLAAARGITITQSGIGDLMLLADPRELTRVVSNLVGNSIRHAPADSEIIVSAHRSADDRIVVSVLDQGPGVASQDLGRMFDMGWRGDSARTDAGAGLGLAIVRGIVEAHGGEVSAEQVPEGFRLNVVLPAR